MIRFGNSEKPAGDKSSLAYSYRRERDFFFFRMGERDWSSPSSPCYLDLTVLPIPVSSPLLLHIPRIPGPDAANHLVQPPHPPRDPASTAPPPARAYPNHGADLGAAGGAPSHGPRRRGGPRKAAQLRCDATRCRHPPPPQPPPPRHPSSAASAAASTCSSPAPARSSSCPCS